MQLSVVVPCYNEDEVLMAFLERMSASCIDAVGVGNYEIILINDGSQDRTLDIMAKKARDDAQLVVVDLFRNHGHQLAVSAGLMIARGERVMLIDADLQDPPELLGDFIAKLDEGFDVVYGQRRQRAGESLFKRLSAKLFYRVLSNISDVNIPLDTGDFRIMTRDVVQQLNAMPEAHRFLRGMVAWVGGRQVALHYDRDERAAGETKYNFGKMLLLALDAMTGFSAAPLRFTSHVAIVAMMLAVGLMTYVVYSVFVFDAAPGWASLGTILLAFSSIQLLAISIIGEYISRIFIQSKQRPLVHVRQVIGGSSNNEVFGHDRAHL